MLFMTRRQEHKVKLQLFSSSPLLPNSLIQKFKDIWSIRLARLTQSRNLKFEKNSPESLFDQDEV